jgi:predicted dehydrogenase
MTKFIKYGLIGTGVGADFCARGFSLLQERKIARIVAVSSKRQERAKKFASRWNLKKIYTDYEEMLQKADIDAVIINTPHYLHYTMSMDAIKAEKHVLVDKPIAINLDEADKMIKEAENKKLKLGVIFQSRFDPTFRKIKAAVEEGRFGRLILGEAIVKWHRTQEYYNKSPWRGCWATEGGGALINQAIHTIDLLLWIMGPPRYLWAQFDTFTHKIDVEDLAVATIRFENGALGVIQGSTSIYPGLPTRLEIYGVKGTTIVEGEKLKRWSVIGEEERIVKDVKDGLKSWASPELVPAINHASLIKDFTQAILEKRQPYVNGHEGIKSLEVIRAIYKSGKTQRRVDFPLKE